MTSSCIGIDVHVLSSVFLRTMLYHSTHQDHLNQVHVIKAPPNCPLQSFDICSYTPSLSRWLAIANLRTVITRGRATVPIKRTLWGLFVALKYEIRRMCNLGTCVSQHSYHPQRRYDKGIFHLETITMTKARGHIKKTFSLSNIALYEIISGSKDPWRSGSYSCVKCQ